MRFKLVLCAFKVVFSIFWELYFIQRHLFFQISLNEGGHQLRLFSQGPNGVDPFTEKCLRDTNVRKVPCASLLVRLAKVPRGPKGRPLEVICLYWFLTQ